MASIFQRGEIWWIAYYRNGKLVRESLKTKSKRKAEREQTALENELLDPHRRVKSEKNPVVTEFWEKYLDKYANAHLRQPTIDIITRHWNMLVDHTGALRLGDITPEQVQEFKEWRKSEGASDQSVNNALKDITAVYNRATKMGLYTGINPAAGIERFKIGRRRPKYHSLDDLESLIEAAREQGRQTEWIVLLGACAGLRRKEIVNARWEWFDWNKSKPMIHVSAFEGFELKDSEDRHVPMSTRIREAMHPHRKSSGFVFTSDKPSAGKHRYRYDPKRSLMTALKKAKLSMESPFQRLRHTFGSLHADKGTPLHKLSRWMGHSSVKVTERHYIGEQSYDSAIDAF